MQRSTGGLGSAVASAIALLASVGCTAPGVGDPCNPESVPPGGFVGSEAYLETSSVQCRTRVCMVYQLQGYPNFPNPDNPMVGTCGVPPDTTPPEECASLQSTNDRVYCTCRCAAPEGSTASLCDCPDGFTCHEVIDSPGAGAGIRGSYCLKDGTFTVE